MVSFFAAEKTITHKIRDGQEGFSGRWPTPPPGLAFLQVLWFQVDRFSLGALREPITHNKVVISGPALEQRSAISDQKNNPWKVVSAKNAPPSRNKGAPHRHCQMLGRTRVFWSDMRLGNPPSILAAIFPEAA
jgi:hypothetical protein